MKKLFLLVFITLSFSSFATDSFRLENGDLILVGQSKSEVIALAGTPLDQDVTQIAVDNGQGGTPIKREVLTYKMKGSIGGLYLVMVTVENAKVVSVASKQQNRI